LGCEARARISFEKKAPALKMAEVWRKERRFMLLKGFRGLGV
jgi:hypothetical protein